MGDRNVFVIRADVLVQYAGPGGDVVVPEGVTAIGKSAFIGCKSLRSITLPNGVKAIGDSAFQVCTALQSITLPESLTAIGSRAFMKCAALTAVTLPRGLKTIERSAFDSCTSLADIALPEELEEIGENAFRNCVSLTEVTLPGRVTTLGRGAFEGCTALTAVTLPDSLTTIRREAFKNCAALTGVILPEGLSAVEADAFFRCRSLARVALPKGLCEIAKSAFEGCTALTKRSIIRYPAGEKPERLDQIEEAAEEETAEDAAPDTGEFVVENGVLVQYTGPGGDVVVPDGVTVIGDDAFYDWDTVTSVALPEGVTVIGRFAFSGCISLQSITLPKSVTTVKDHAFSRCKNLKSITLPASLTDIASQAFWDCTALKEDGFIRYPAGAKPGKQNEIDGAEKEKNEEAEPSANDFVIKDCVLVKYNGSGGDVIVPEGVTAISYGAFYNCTNLEHIVLPDRLMIIGENAFSGCTSLKSIELPKTLKKIGKGAFRSCEGLTDVSFADGLQSIGGDAFKDCSSLKHVVLPDSVTDICEGAFCFCTRLTSIKLSEKLKIIGDKAFWNCRSLNEIKLPSSVKYVGDEAFRGCGSLARVALPESLKQIEKSAFVHCTSLKKSGFIRYPAGTKPEWPDETGSAEKEKNERGAPNANDYIIRKSVLTKYRGDDGDVIVPDGVTAIGEGAFWYNSDLTSVVLPKGVRTIGRAAFQECDGLTSIVLPDGLLSIGDTAFFKCERLESITLPDSLTDIGSSAFAGCIRLEKLVIPNGVKSIGEGAFENCKRLKDIELTTDGIKVGKNAFVGCKTEIMAPEKLDNAAFDIENGVLKKYNGSAREVVVPAGVTAIGISAFFKNHSLTRVVLPESVETIEMFAFSDCIKLTHIELPKGVISIGDWAFRSCESLTGIALPDGLSSIGEGAFSRCYSLRSIVLPDSVTSIGKEAFLYCGLTDVQLPDRGIRTGRDAFRGCEIKEEDIAAHSGKQELDQESIAKKKAYHTLADLLGLPREKQAMIDDPRAYLAGHANDYEERGIGSDADDDTVIWIGIVDALVAAGKACELDWKESLEEFLGELEEILPDGLSIDGIDSGELDENDDIPVWAGQISELWDGYEIAFLDIDSDSYVVFVSKTGDLAKLRDAAQEVGHRIEGVRPDTDEPEKDAEEDAVFDTGEFFIGDGVLVKYNGPGGKVVVPDGVTEIGAFVFRECAGLTAVVLPNSVTVIGEYAFYCCRDLESVALPKGLTELGDGAFLGCESLTRIAVPDWVRSIGENTFYGCTALETVALPNGLKSIGKNAFSDCTALADVALPGGLEIIGDYAFYGCGSLAEIALPGGLETIGKSAFFGCTSLKTIALPESLTSIGEYAFGNCTGLEWVALMKNLDVGESVFSGCTSLAGKVVMGHPEDAETEKAPSVTTGAEEVAYIPREDFRRSGGFVGENGEGDECDAPDIEPVLEKVNEVLPPQPIVGFEMERVESGELSVFDSKLGGTPYFPKDMEYPCGRSGEYRGKPLALLAQLNFEELPHIPDFPTKGILQFFIAPDDYYGWDPDGRTAQDNFRVIYHETILRDETKLLSAEDIPAFGDMVFPFSGEYRLEADEPELLPATKCDFRFQRAFVTQYNALADEPIDSFFDLDDEIGEALFDSDETPKAWIGGYPMFAQIDPRDDDESLADCDVLLFELDSCESDDLEIMWGDVGTGSFLIPRDRLRNLDFSRVLYNQDSG